VTLVGRVVRAPPAAVAAAVAFLPVLYLAVGGGLFAAWVVVPDRRAVPAMLSVVILAGAALWGPSWSAQGIEAEGVSVRVLTWNLRRLWGGPADAGDPLACAVRTIEEEDPDVLALLEVSAHDVAALEEALSMRCVHHPYLSTSGPRRGGLAACARGGWTLKSGSGQRFVDDEDWYYVAAEVQQGHGVINLLAVHLYPYEYVAKRLRTGVGGLAQGDPNVLRDLQRQSTAVVKGQSDQSAALLHRVARFSDPTVVAGDFNSTRDAALHGALRGLLTDAWERGGHGFGGTVELFDWLPLRIDYVYATEQLTVARAEVPDAGCSDHLPVLADLILTPAPPEAPPR